MVSAADFVATIRSVVGHTDEPIGLHVPEIGDLEKKYLLECLDSTFVSSVGAFIPKLEQRIQEITGAKPVRDANFIGAWFAGNSRPT